MRKLSALIINHDRTIEERKLKIQKNKVEIEKNDDVLFEPSSIMHKIKRKPFPFNRFPLNRLFNSLSYEPCLIIFEGKLRAETPKDPELFVPLTKFELVDLIRRLMAKSLGKAKQLTVNLFIILLIVGILNLLFLILLMSGVTIR